MYNFKLLEFICCSNSYVKKILNMAEKPLENKNSKKLYEDNWIKDINKYIAEDLKLELDKEIKENQLKSVGNIIVLSSIVDSSPPGYFFDGYMAFCNNKEVYNKFLEVQAYKLIPNDYYLNCRSISLEKKGIKVVQIHNKELLLKSDLYSEYIYLDITFDYKIMTLESFMVA